MKTNFVKKGSEKSIEMFQMSNNELMAISGGFTVKDVLNPDGTHTIVITRAIDGFPFLSFMNRFF